MDTGFCVVICSQRLFDGGGNAGGQVAHLVGLHVDMVREIEVAGGVERHQMDVYMRHIDTDNRHTHLTAGTYLLDSLSHTLAKQMQTGKEIVIQIEDIINLALGDAENMALDHRIDI